MTVWFGDTCILCNLLPVPGRDQQRQEVIEQLKGMQERGDSLILPVTAVIETGNHISHLTNGHERRTAAKTFEDVLTMVIEGKAPWQLHGFAWDENFLGRLVNGAGTGQSLVRHATTGLGCGDLCVLTERAIYIGRTGLSDVRIWTIDGLLSAHS